MERQTAGVGVNIGVEARANHDAVPRARDRALELHQCKLGRRQSPTTLRRDAPLA